MKIAVITPYFNEPIRVLKRCYESVARQRELKETTVTHFFIADGTGLEALDAFPNVRHLRLGLSHNDNGNTPRAVGGLCALSEGFDAICYLDADNLYDSLHLSSVIQEHENSKSEVVFSSRYSFFPNGDCYDFSEAEGDEDRIRSHVDTSCINIFGSALRAVALWGEMPHSFGPVCDRIFFQYLTSHHRCSWTNQKTVFFETWYAGHFSRAAIPQPWNAKEILARDEAEWLGDFQQFERNSRSPISIKLKQSWITPSQRRIRILQINSTDQSLVRHFIGSLSQVRGFIPDPGGGWNRYLISKFPELKDIAPQGAQSDADANASTAGLLKIAELVNEELPNRLLADLSPYQRKHLTNHGWLTICTSSTTVLDNLRAAIRETMRLDSVVTKKITFIGPPIFFSHFASADNHKAHPEAHPLATGDGRKRPVSHLDLDNYCRAIISGAIGCGPRQTLMLPMRHSQTPSRDFLYKIQQFTKLGPDSDLELPSQKYCDLGECFDFFSEHDKYSKELAMITEELKRGIEATFSEIAAETDAPTTKNNQTLKWSRVHHSFWQHREDFAPFFDIPEPASNLEEDFKVIRSIERAGRILRERKEMAAKYGFI